MEKWRKEKEKYFHLAKITKAEVMEMLEMVENRMVIDPEWKWKEDFPEISEKLHGKGYFEMGTGIFVPEEDAFLYALERIKKGTEEEKWEFTDWFYSGNWIKED